MLIYLLDSNSEGQTPDQSDLQDWADRAGLTFPVLADTEGAGMNYEEDYGIPSIHLLGPGAEVVLRDAGTITAQDIEAVLPW